MLLIPSLVNANPTNLVALFISDQNIPSTTGSALDSETGTLKKYFIHNNKDISIHWLYQVANSRGEKVSLIRKTNDSYIILDTINIEGISEVIDFRLNGLVLTHKGYQEKDPRCCPKLIMNKIFHIKNNEYILDQSTTFNDGYIAYEHGEYQVAFEIFKQLAEHADADSQHSLAVMYANGDGVFVDDKKAVVWNRKAAEQGNAKAQNDLAFAYEFGNGVLEDNEEAVKWYQKSAAQGYAKAQYNLGSLYYNSHGTLKDNEKAVKLFQKAAEQGDVNAQAMYIKIKGIRSERAAEPIDLKYDGSNNNNGPNYSSNQIGKSKSSIVSYIFLMFLLYIFFKIRLFEFIRPTFRFFVEFILFIIKLLKKLFYPNYFNRLKTLRKNKINTPEPNSKSYNPEDYKYKNPSFLSYKKLIPTWYNYGLSTDDIVCHLKTKGIIVSENEIRNLAKSHKYNNTLPILTRPSEKLSNVTQPDLLHSQTSACNFIESCKVTWNKEPFEVEFEYKKESGETSKRRVHLSHVLNKSGNNYLYGVCQLRQEYRVFRLSRITGAIYVDENEFTRRQFMTYIRKNNRPLESEYKKNAPQIPSFILPVEVQFDYYNGNGGARPCRAKLSKLIHKKNRRYLTGIELPAGQVKEYRTDRIASSVTINGKELSRKDLIIAFAVE